VEGGGCFHQKEHQCKDEKGYTLVRNYKYHWSRVFKVRGKGKMKNRAGEFNQGQILLAFMSPDQKFILSSRSHIKALKGGTI
jgi:hypothetical protein